MARVSNPLLTSCRCVSNRRPGRVCWFGRMHAEGGGRCWVGEAEGMAMAYVLWPQAMHGIMPGYSTHCEQYCEEHALN
jgi:hypothetical protein